MLFNSISFLIFLPVVFFLYWALWGKWRIWLMLIAGMYFYMSFVPKYIFILFFLITVDFFLGQLIEKSKERERRVYLILSVLSNVGTLFVFKYFNFFNENSALLAHAIGWNYSIGTLSLILPIGLSFHIFQSLSYIIEVYRGHYSAERDYVTYAVYVMFFPQLVAGPIERPKNLLPQLHTIHTFNYEKVVEGLRLILRGFFKKVCIADNVSVSVDFIYNNLAHSDSSVVLLALFLFPIQLYCDFSGYSDIALGSAKLFGIDLMRNFNHPFLSTSIEELWRRWHISLSTWFRDYVYYPIVWKTAQWHKVWLYVSIILTFALTGIWHGAGWKYLLMGLLFGSYICVGLLTKKLRARVAHVLFLDRVPRLHALLKTAQTLTLASCAWIFFRAESSRQAFTFLHQLFFEWGRGAFRFLTCHDYCAVYYIGISRKELIFLLFIFACVMTFEYLSETNLLPTVFIKKRLYRWPIYYLLIASILLGGYFVPKTFIYFQF